MQGRIKVTFNLEDALYMTKPEWTTTPPDKPGLYWMWDDLLEEMRPQYISQRIDGSLINPRGYDVTSMTNVRWQPAIVPAPPTA